MEEGDCGRPRIRLSVKLELDKRLDWKHRTCRNSIDNLISAW